MSLARKRAVKRGVKSGPKRKAPLYTLAYGIEVVNEAPANGYVRCYVRPHHLLYNRTMIRKSRVVMTAHLGRRLVSNEHVHHGRYGKLVDTLNNLTLLTADEHNKHHKIGSKHKPEIKAQIASSLKRAYKEGRHRAPWNKGKPLPIAMRKKISKTLRGRVLSPRTAAHCHALSKSLKGLRLGVPWSKARRAAAIAKRRRRCF